MQPVRRARRSVLAAAGSLLILAGLLPVAAAPVALGVTPVFINEIHYDNTGTDTAEAIEIAGPAGTNLTGWSIVLYNGNGGAAYDTDPLGGTIVDGGSGFGAASISYPTDGIQNGSPDGIALVDASNTVVQFLSYEGAFTAVGGPANGLTSVDIGISEATDHAIGRSIGLVGTGTTYEDFSWAADLDDSFGDVNPGQTFGTPTPPDAVLNEFSASTAGADVEYVEVFGASNTDLSALTILEVEGDSGTGTSTGTVDEVIAVGTTDANGIWLGNLSSNALENGTISLLLVSGFTGALGADLDTDNDGTLDATPWTGVVDAVAVNDGGASDLTYGTPSLAVSYDGLPFAPGGASRIPDGTDTDTTADWVRNDFDLAGIPPFDGTPAVGEAYNTPGAPNAVVPPAPGLIINELDSDTAGTDALEFVELYDGGVGDSALDGLVVVFYNGSNDLSYAAFDLDGFDTNAEGYFLLGNAAVTPTPAIVFAGNFLQNGADAVAVFQGDAADFPTNTPVTTAALRDAIAYDTDDADDVGLLALLNSGQPQVNEGGSGNSAAHSNQRCPNGSGGARNTAAYIQLVPTPGVENDCPTGLSINDVSANEGDAGTTSFNFTVSLSEPAPAGGVTFDIATADGTATTAGNDYVAQSLTGQSIPEGATTYVFSVLVNGDIANEGNETFFVDVTNVVGAVASDAQGVGTIANDDLPVTFIHDIQGSGSAITGTGPFAIEGIVVGDYQTQGSGQLRGFFVQEENADADAAAATSEGIFVFCSSCPVAVNVGDKVRVTGGASEFFDMSQLTASSATSVFVLGTGNPLPSAATVELPVPGVPTGDLAAATAAINAYFEPFEGMLVTYPDTLSVSEYFELARYGQLILSEGGRPHQFTATNAPSASGLVDHEIDLARRTVILDDTDNRQNRPVDAPNTAYYHPVPGLSTGNFFRGGDTITNLTGVLHWSFAGQTGTDAWRIRPVTEAFSYAFTPTNPRPAAPDVDGRLKVASFNVLNYFLTIDTTSSNDVGTCGPSGTMDCRGADSAAELARQREKLLEALSAIDADVFGFMEMENSQGVEPLADIVAGLPGYDYIDTGVIGTDAIRVGIIYRTSTVEPVGDHAILDSTVDPRFNDDLNRPALAQTFEEIDTGAHFTVVVNHLKSKGSDCNHVGDPDTGDGQGNCAVTRTLAAEAMADWLATDPTGSGDRDVLIIGDLNSYAKEDPIAALQDAGYTDLVASFGGAAAYGYVFDGQLGYLDHALANPTLTPQVAGVVDWHINADEVPLFDYNDVVRDAGEAAFEEESDVHPLYEANEFRTSDHDPVIIGLDLVDFDFVGFREPVGTAPATVTANAGSVVPVKFSLGGDLGLSVLFEAPQVYLCTSYPFGSTETAASADGLGLTYDPAEDLYQFDWKTRKPWANTCRTFEVTFDDGSYRTIDVNFVK